MLSLIIAAATAATLGKVDFPVTVNSREARTHFEHGVLLLHSFMYDDARDEFRAASAKEPGFAMAYWGEALTFNHSLWGEQDAPPATAALAKIPANATLTERERGLIDAVRLLYAGAVAGPAAEGGHCAVPAEKSAEKDKRDTAYMEAMDRLHQRFPADDEIALFDALARIAKNTVRLRMQAGAIALDVFARKPDHPGAAHYVIHAFDDPEHAILALPAAKHYALIAPSASHALHMPSHIFVQLGMWPEAEASNRASFAANESVWKAKHLPIGDRDWHSLGFLSSVALQQGKRSVAAEAAATACGKDAVVDLEVRFGCALIASMLAIESDHPSAEPVALLVDKPAPAARADQNQAIGPISEAQVAYVLGLAAAADADAPNAAHYASELRAMKDKLQKYRDGQIARLADAQAAQIEARLALRKGGKPDEWIAPLRKFAEQEASDSPTGPAFRLSTQEVLAEVLFASGKFADAAGEYRGVLERRPHRAHAMLGLARSLAKSGDAAGASQQYRELAEMWKSADADWPALDEVRAAARSN